MLFAHCPMNAHRCKRSCVEINCTNVAYMQSGFTAGYILITFAGCTQLSLQQVMQQRALPKWPYSPAVTGFDKSQAECSNWIWYMSKIVHVNCKRCTTQQQLECLCAHLLHAAGPAQESVECATCGGTNAPRLRPTPHSSPVLHCHWPCSAQRLAKRSCVLKNTTRKHLRLLACGVDHAICIISRVSGSVPVYPFVVASTGWLAGIAATRCV